MRIDFYILEGQTNRDTTVCRLCEKAYQQGGTIYIHTNSRAHAQSLDDLLWTYRDGSFLPHQLAGTTQPDQPNPAILIGWETNTQPDDRKIMINLATTIPDFYTKFERVAEIVNQNQEIKMAGRKRFAFYRDQGHDLHHHTL